MSFVSFLGLVYQIFLAKIPNIAWIRHQWLLATKIGQLYALRADFIGIERSAILTKLYEQNFDTSQKNTPSVSHFTETFQSHFRTIDTAPFSEASIGKVYRAELTDGTEVVIKVIKDDFRPSFVRDVTKLKRYFRGMIFFYPKLAKVADPIGTLEDLERMTLSELDLQNEIKGIAMLQKTLTQHQDFLATAVQFPLSFPRTYPELSSEMILVSDKLTGKSFRELLETHTLPYPVLLDFFFQHVFCMLLDGYFHEDIHSGNIFYQDEKIYLLDNGSIGFASGRLRKWLVTMFYHLTHDEFAEAAVWLVSMANNVTENEKHFDQFQKDFVKLYAGFNTKTLAELSLTQQMMASIKMAVHAGYVFERGMYPIIKSFMYLDGMARQCKPDTILMQDVRPLIEKC